VEHKVEMIKILVLCLISVVFSQNTNCSKIPIQGDSAFIDLGPIIGKELTWPIAFAEYKVSLCINTFSTCGQCNGPAGFCLYTSQGQDCIGQFSSADVLVDREGVELFYDNGDRATSGRVQIICDPDIELSTPTYGMNPAIITVRSKYACGSTPPPPVSDCKKILDTAGSGAHYDLSPIIGQQIFWKDPSSNFKVSVCANSYADCGTCDGPAGFCQYTNTWNDCVGQYSMAVGLPEGNGVDLFYDNGDFGNSGRVRFICDPTIDISLPAFTNPYLITVRSKYACLCHFVCVPPY